MQIDKVVVLASALIKNKAGKYLLLKRSNKSSYAHYWQFVEGKLEEGELPLTALKREIKEEINAIASIIKLDCVFHTLAEVKGKSYLGFRITFNVKLLKNKIELSNEHEEYGWFTKKEIFNLKLLPGVKEIISLQKA